MPDKVLVTSSHAFFCGHLNTVKCAGEVLLLDERWEREKLDQDQYDTISSIYYESFIDSLVEVGDGVAGGVYGLTAHLVMEVNKRCTLYDDRLDAAGYIFDVCKLHLFFFPYNICLFAIEVDEPLGVDPNALTLVHGILRESGFYEHKTIDGIYELKINAPEYIVSLQPLLQICQNGHYSDFTCTGNKLKIFQIISKEELSDELLFELGTLSKIGCVSDEQHYNSPAPDYYCKTMETHSISVFRNWKALALVDTFTVLRKNEIAGLWLWSESYFRLIYMHALYQKTLLFVVNKQFRSKKRKTKYIELLQDMKEQEHWYAFSEISYNFLPQTIYKAIDTGLEIASERKKLHDYLEQEAERQEKISERRFARIITFLTVLTLFSALYDGTSLIREFFGWENTNVCYRIVVKTGGVFVLFGILGLWSFDYWKKR